MATFYGFVAVLLTVIVICTIGVSADACLRHEYDTVKRYVFWGTYLCISFCLMLIYPEYWMWIVVAAAAGLILLFFGWWIWNLMKQKNAGKGKD